MFFSSITTRYTIAFYDMWDRIFLQVFLGFLSPFKKEKHIYAFVYKQPNLSSTYEQNQYTI